MGKFGTFITGSLSLVFALLGGYLLELQRDETLQPFNEYMDFDGFVLTQLLHGYESSA